MSFEAAFIKTCSCDFQNVSCFLGHPVKVFVWVGGGVVGVLWWWFGGGGVNGSCFVM